MATHAFFEDQTKSAVRSAIERVEKQTSAEVVVTVFRTAGHYRDADLVFGVIMAFACFAFLLFAEREFDTRWMPFDVGVVFVAAALLCAYTPTLRRLFVSGKRRAENTRRFACTSFHEQKIGRTTGRNGILVFVAMFERKVAVVCDLGVDPKLLAEPIARLEAAVDQWTPDATAFIQALEAFGPTLAPAMPRREDDVNELPDDVGVA